MDAAFTGLNGSMRKTHRQCRLSAYLTCFLRSCLFISITFLFSVLFNPSWALPGGLDSTFGGAFGRYFINLSSDPDRATAIARLPDGRFLLAGSCGPNATEDFCITRRLPNGQQDTSFGDAFGKVATSISSGADRAAGLAIELDGRFVVAGTCDGQFIRVFCLVRYLPNGSLDASFGAGGIAREIIGAGDPQVAAIARTPVGHYVVGGTCWDGARNTMCIARFLTSGALDNSFGISGRQLVPTNAELVGRGLVLDVDGGALLAGSCGNGQLPCVYRFTRDGSIDSGFGVQGSASITVGGRNAIASANAIALQADRNIVIAGNCPVLSGTGYCIARFLADGKLDNSFGTNGLARLSLGSTLATPSAIGLQTDGRIVVVGSCLGSNFDFCMLRLNDNGGTDESFGTNGVVKTNVIDGNDFALATLIQPDGKIVVAGQCTESFEPNNAAFCVARYEGGPFGARNCSFDIDGDGVVLGTSDLFILSRVAAGMQLRRAVNGVVFSPNATRRTWPDIRTYLRTQCNQLIDD